MFSEQDVPVRLSPSQDSEKAWATLVATSPSTFLKFLMKNGPIGWSTRTSPVCYQAFTMMLPMQVSRRIQWSWSSMDKRWSQKMVTLQKKYTPLTASWPDFQSSGMGGPTGFLTASMVEYRSGAVASGLLDILEVWEDPRTKEHFKNKYDDFLLYLARYCLTPRACRGILRRALNRGKTLPPQLAAALQEVADSEPMLTSEEDSSLESQILSEVVEPLEDEATES